MVNIKKHFKEIFALDLRMLALFRILISIILIWNICERLLNVEAFMSDSGAIPLEILKSVTPWPWNMSIYHLTGDSRVQTVLLLFELGFAVAMLLGFRSRISTFIAWFFLCSAQTRNPLILFGGDEYLRVLLFWLMFLPTDMYFSVKAKSFSLVQSHLPTVYFSIASFALISQILNLYFFSGIHKINSMWIQGEALSYILSGSHMVKPFGHLILQTLPPNFLKVGGTLVVALEILFPLAILLAPPKNYFRWIFLFLIMSLHLFLDLTLRLEFFSSLSMAALLIFFRKSAQTEMDSQPTKLIAGLLCGLLILSLYSNVRSVKTHEKDQGFSGRVLNALQLQQDWSMFAQPLTWDGVLFAEAITKDGKKVDLISGHEIIKYDSLDKNAFDDVGYLRWLRLLVKTTVLKESPFDFTPLSKWYCRQQNIDGVKLTMGHWLLPGQQQPVRDFKKIDLGTYPCP